MKGGSILKAPMKGRLAEKGGTTQTGYKVTVKKRFSKGFSKGFNKRFNKGFNKQFSK
jgi:hypothetical protein